jgi:hypothetical protein
LSDGFDIDVLILGGGDAFDERITADRSKSVVTTVLGCGSLLGFDRRFASVGVAQRHRVAGMARMRLGPPAGRTLREKFITVGTPRTGDAPRLYFVGEMTHVALVIEREPFECSVPNAKCIEFVAEIPFRTTAATGHRRRVIDIVRCRAIAIELVRHALP